MGEVSTPVDIAEQSRRGQHVCRRGQMPEERHGEGSWALGSKELASVANVLGARPAWESPPSVASSDQQGCRQGGAAPLSNSGVHRKDLAAPDTGL